MIKQAYISKGVAHFAERFMANYGLRPFDNPDEPTVIFGMYYDEDYHFLIENNVKIIVWCGVDSAIINKRGAYFVAKSEALNIASLSGIQANLKKVGLPYLDLKVTAANLSLTCEPRGDKIYHYGDGTDKYGESMLDEIEQQTGIEILRYKSLQMPYDEFMKINPYRDCFVCLGTSYTGSGTTMIEMGLMGRRSINNGNLPHAVKYRNVKDIVRAVKKEYERRHEDNLKIYQSFSKTYNIGTEWL